MMLEKSLSCVGVCAPALELGREGALLDALSLKLLGGAGAVAFVIVDVRGRPGEMPEKLVEAASDALARIICSGVCARKA